MLARRTHRNRTLSWDGELEKRISEITPEQILKAVRESIDPEDISIVRVGSFDGVEPEEQDALH